MRKSVTARFVVYIASLLIIICGSLGLIAINTASNALINNIIQQLPVSYTHLDVYKRQGNGAAA